MNGKSLRALRKRISSSALGTQGDSRDVDGGINYHLQGITLRSTVMRCALKEVISLSQSRMLGTSATVRASRRDYDGGLEFGSELELVYLGKGLHKADD